MLLGLMRDRSPRILTALFLVGSALTVKSMANALFFGPYNAFAWLTPGAKTGLLVGAAMLSGLVLSRPETQYRVSILMLILSMIAVNIAPTNPYFIATLQTWVQGQFLNFNGAAQFLSLWWPIIALWFLFHRNNRGKSR